MPLDDWAEELEFVKALVIGASEVSLRRSERVRPEEKHNRSFVTDLDREIEQLMRSRLGERFPDDRLTGEEYEASGGSGPRVWSIDPIDGTGNLVHGLPIWAISLGLIEHGRPVLGIIALPPLGELFWAVEGGGAWKDEEPIHAAADTDVFHPHDNMAAGTNALRAVDPRTLPGRLRDLGSACCEMVFTAMGRLTATTMLGEYTHDIAAGTIIAAEAGCQFGTVDGRVLTPAEFLADTPVSVPTFVAPPRRLAALMAQARRMK